jgi:hypothetical protein
MRSLSAIATCSKLRPRLEQSSARRIHSPMARGVHRYPSHPRVLFIHSREAKFVTADVSRALLAWPLIGSLLTISEPPASCFSHPANKCSIFELRRLPCFPHGMPGHAGHAMMAMIIANDGRFLKKEGTAWQSGEGIAARSKSVSWRLQRLDVPFIRSGN